MPTRSIMTTWKYEATEVCTAGVGSTCYSIRYFVTRGCLISYGGDNIDQYRPAGRLCRSHPQGRDVGQTFPCRRRPSSSWWATSRLPQCSCVCNVLSPKRLSALPVCRTCLVFRTIFAASIGATSHIGFFAENLAIFPRSYSDIADRKYFLVDN